MKKVMNKHYHYDYPYIDNDTFYHIPASFGSIEEAFARIKENDIISKHCGGPEGWTKNTTYQRACNETLKIYTREMFGVLRVDDEDRRHELIEQLKRFLKLLGYCNTEEYLRLLENSTTSFMAWWFVYKHDTFINTNLFKAMLLAYESRHMSEENKERALYMVKSTIENYATSRYIPKKVVLFNSKKLISLWRDAEVKPEKKRTDPN